MSEKNIESLHKAISKMAELYGLSVMTQFVLEEKGMDSSNQLMLNLEMLNSLREQVKILVTLSNLNND
jgi:hypothetical protein